MLSSAVRAAVLEAVVDPPHLLGKRGKERNVMVIDALHARKENQREAAPVDAIVENAQLVLDHVPAPNPRRALSIAGH